MKKSLTFLCISCYFKGEAFLKSCKEQGNTVFLLTKQSLKDADWPRESIDEMFFMEKEENTPENIANIIKGVAWLMKERKIDAVVALDDFDVEKAAAIREEFRIPGMGQTTARYFRDKLAMRLRALDAGISVPAFSPLFNNDEINHFADTVPAPWVVKPRSEASAMGIKKVFGKEQLWDVINGLGDDRHGFLVEQFKPGDVFHVDSVTFDGKVEFTQVSKYLTTPFEVAHGAGIFRSVTCEYGSDDVKQLEKENKAVMKAFGMRQSASHSEFIKCHEDGKFYFLETSSRVGGAHLAEMVETASGINLWWEWAKIEDAAARKESYKAPKPEKNNAGIMISLARYEYPDQSVFNAPEVVWKINKKHHVGVIVTTPDRDRLFHLLDEYAQIVYRDFHASAPMPDKPDGNIG